MLKILLLLPDSSKNPFGGMGVQAEGIMSASSCTFVEHNITNNLLTLDENVLGTTVVNQLIAQASNLPKIEDLKDVNIVHSFDASTSLQGHALAKMLGVPHIITLQLSMDSLSDMFYKHLETPDKYFLSTIEISCLNLADAVIHVSKEYLSKYGLLNPNSFYLPNGIDITKWEEVSYSKIVLPGRPNAKKLCYIGRFAEMKNIIGILNAYIPEDVDIYFIGGQRGGHEYFFNAMVNFVDKTPNAYYLGEKHGDEKVNTLKAMDAVIVPSIHEPFGIVCLEALASGCVLLSSFQSGMKEYLTEDIAVNCGITPEEITNGINKWLLLDDISERKERGYALCKQYSWDNAANILESIYKKVLTK
jgi:glycosyltransferase involved in cell wall biosynthesis